MRRFGLRPRGRATKRQYVALVALLALSGMALAVLMMTAVTRADPSAGDATAPATGIQARAAQETLPAAADQEGTGPDSGIHVGYAAESESGSGLRSEPDSESESAAHQAFGWLYHRDYPMDDSGEQIVFAITRDADGAPAIKAFGIVWNRPAGLDVSFEVPAGLSAPLPLQPDEISGTDLSRLETARIPTIFTDRTGGSRPRTHPGTVTIELEGVSDTYGVETIGEWFSPYTGEWTVEFESAMASEWRLAMVGVTLDCPELGIFQQVVSDWENDFAEVFYGEPLSIEVRGWGPAGMLYSDIQAARGGAVR